MSEHSSNNLPPINYTALNEALRSRSEELVSAWLPGGTRRGHEYVCADLRGGAGTSCSVNLKTGAWADFAADERGGDLISLYACIHSLDMGKAAVILAREHGLESVAGIVHGGNGHAASVVPSVPAVQKSVNQKQEEGWRVITPVPDFAPAPTFKNNYRSLSDLDHTARYAIDGVLYGYVVRFRTSKGAKETLPYTWCHSERDNTQCWYWKTWTEPRPLYFPGGVSPKANAGGSMPTVVVVEGEKKANLLHDLLHKYMPGIYVVVSWQGGCKAWKKSDWHWLKGCHVLLWPDCDAHRVSLSKAEKSALGSDVAIALAQSAKPLLEPYKQPGMAAMLGIGAMLRDAQGCTVQILPIPALGTVKDGWDCADAIESDGWGVDRVLEFFGKAEALPVDLAPETEKIDGPVGTDTTLDADVEVVGNRAIPQWLACYWDAKNKRWHTSRKMVIAILQNDPELTGILAYNELANSTFVRRAWPWSNSKAGPATDEMDLRLNMYLSDKYGLPSISRQSIQEAIESVAHTNAYHPYREFIQQQVWDGTERIDKWFIYVLGEDPQKLPKAMVEYLSLVGRFWILGIVYRVFEPGCKFDYCPVLEGKGGLRKSTLVEVLAGSQYFSDTPFDVAHGKEAQEQVQGLVLYEIAELAHFSKAEVGLIKAFISSKVDRYRAAYGAVLSTFPRQCVLVGTTNENTYLRDRTGNRRFWPVPVNNIIKTEWVQRNRGQLFAEAYALYLQRADYTPTVGQERRLFVPMQESRLVETAVVSELYTVLTREPTAVGIGAVVNDLTSFVNISQLTQALGIDAAKSSPALEAQIRGWLDHEGWERKKRMVNGVRSWGYERPKDWPKQKDLEMSTDQPDGAAGSSTDAPSEPQSDEEPF